ncbi:MAG: histidine kinase [Bacteroidales bacterium]|nr:histidine kinase [Bacteroidales bacterium]
MKRLWRYSLRHFWLSPWFIALPVTVLIILFLPDIFRKYSVEVVDSGATHKPNALELYQDLNGDGNSEQIVYFDNTEGKASLKINDHKGFILDHFYFPGKILLKVDAITVGAYDSTGSVGIFLFTRVGDSLFLHGIAPMRSEKVLFRDLFIGALEPENGENDFSLTTTWLIDLDRDGIKEIVSGIMAGFRAQPRFLFSYNLKTGELKKTDTGVLFQSVTDTADLNGDGRPELITDTYAIDNNQGRISARYDDNSAWLVAYDRDFNFCLPPVQFPGRYIRLAPEVVRIKSSHFFFILLEPRNAGTGTARLMLFNAKGEKMRERQLDDTLRHRFYDLFRSRESDCSVFLSREGGIIERYDTSLTVVERKRIESPGSTLFQCIDIDGDGKQECLFRAANEKAFIITDNEFSHPIRLDNPLPGQIMLSQSIREAGKRGKLCIQDGNKRAVFSWEPNPWYYFRYPVYFLIFLIVLGFILLVQYLQRKRMRQQIAAEKKITELQLLLLNNQLDPHFTFNAINSISAMILDGKPDDANRNLLSLSRLMRSTVLQTDKLSRTLGEELDFLQHYINLMQSRMNDSFTCRMDLDDQVDMQVQVPKMITQIFVENAIKHGLKPLQSGGMLEIRIRQEKSELVIGISDNGVGRKEAGVHGEHGTGKGISIIDQTIRIINKFNKRKINYVIVDPEDEQGQSTGTTVIITIPVDMNYSFYKS